MHLDLWDQEWVKRRLQWNDCCSILAVRHHYAWWLVTSMNLTDPSGVKDVSMMFTMLARVVKSGNIVNVYTAEVRNMLPDED
ncbi:hypothetical protein SP19_114 [Salmonella phage 19]|nr:hypothetical protein SP19_114 [Salmonella phage 19]